MAFLSLNGIALGVLGGARRKDVEIGMGTVRAYDGSLLRSNQAFKREWSLKTPPMTQAESVAWVKLLQGLHDHWNFNTDTYSDKGLASTITGTVTITTSSPTPKYGLGQLNTASGTGNYITWNTGCVDSAGNVSCTVTVWRYESGAWHWYWITVSGGSVAVYKDGSSSAISLPAWLTVTNGNVKIIGIAGTAFQYDDLCVYPFAAPTSWQSSMYTFAQASAAPTAPKLYVSGDIAPATTYAMGKVDNADDIVGNLSGGLSDNLEPLEVQLLET